MSPSPGAPAAPKIHEATLGPRPTGEVFKGAELTEQEAVDERRAGRDVVVCGPDLKSNHDVAKRIESAVGPCRRERNHPAAGTYALPHYQADPRPPSGHTFYETEKTKARRSKPTP